MLQTALRWMGARWWAAAAMAATVIILFRMTEVDAPSSVGIPVSDGAVADGGGTNPYGAGLMEASFRKAPASKFGPQPKGQPQQIQDQHQGQRGSMSADLEFLELRQELAETKGALRAERERAALYSENYGTVTRQYSEISRLAALLMKEADAAGEAPARTPEQRALVERALGLMELRAHGARAQAAYSAQGTGPALGPATSPGADRTKSVPRPASATLRGPSVPQPTEAIFTQTAHSGSEQKP